jgi:hypothetical protein
MFSYRKSVSCRERENQVQANKRLTFLMLCRMEYARLGSSLVGSPKHCWSMVV